MHRYDWFNEGPCFDFFGHGYMSMWWIGLLVLIIGLFIFLYMRRNKVQRIDTPLNMLQMMFVKGEISQEEYERRKSVLKDE
jgi:uncharacterized membrane protein